MPERSGVCTRIFSIETSPKCLHVASCICADSTDNRRRLRTFRARSARANGRAICWHRAVEPFHGLPSMFSPMAKCSDCLVEGPRCIWCTPLSAGRAVGVGAPSRRAARPVGLARLRKRQNIMFINSKNRRETLLGHKLTLNSRRHARLLNDGDRRLIWRLNINNWCCVNDRLNNDWRRCHFDSIRCGHLTARRHDIPENIKFALIK